MSEEVAGSTRKSPSPGAPAADPLVGKVLGDCRIECLIGRGGMGSVYRAHHLTLDKPVAIKILSPFLAMDEEYVERFLNEARAAARLEHPNIVQVYGFAADKEVCYMVLQYVEGRSLDRLLGRNGRLNVAQATRVARDVASGLAAAHAQGIVHRDIKPANILLARDGIAKIADFGIARRLKQPSGLTHTGAFLGSPEFASPEQACGGKVDPRTDLYSLGVTYYRMLSGRLPFEGRSPLDISAKHMRDAPPPIESIVPDLDPRAAALVRRLLRKNPEERYPDARGLLRDLEDILVSRVREEALVPPPSLPPAKDAQVRGPQRQSRNSFLTRDLVFWVAIVSGWVLGFATGASGAGEPADRYWGSLARPFLASSDSRRGAVATAVLAAALLVVGTLLNRGGLAASRWSGTCVSAFLLTALCLYSAGVHAPLAMGEGPPVLRAAKGGLSAWPHRAHFPIVAMGALLTGMALGGARPAGPRRRTAAWVMLAASLVSVYAFGALSGGTLTAPFGRLSEDFGRAMTGCAALVCAAFGMILASSPRGGAKGPLSVLALLLGWAGLYAFAVPDRGSFADSLTVPLREWPAALAAHEAPLTLAAVLAVWAAVLLYDAPKGRHPTPWMG